MTQNPIDDKSALVQAIAWCRQASVDPDLCFHLASLGHRELSESRGMLNDMKTRNQ